MDGLSSAEVEERIRNGDVNSSDVKTSRSYADIIVKNVLTPLNVLLFIIGIALLLLGNLLSALSATGIITVNIIISTVQEMRAKRRLDKISLLTRPKVTVVRNGEEIEIDQSNIVKDDLIIIRSGEQALVDGDLVSCKNLEMDESLLTGESRTVKKNAGDRIYSGSVCITGEGYFVVTAFGNDSYASQMLSSAKKFTSKKTPLQMETQTITTVLMIIAFVLLFLSVIKELILGFSLVDIGTFEDILELFVICLDIIPIALFLLITLTYMIAALRMADTGVLLQRFNSVESLSHVDVVCMDKTGTITTNNLVFESAEHLVDPDYADEMIRLFANATGSRNKTIRAIIKYYGDTEFELLDEIQFSSSREFSAVKIRKDGEEHTLFSGAWPVISKHMEDAEKVDPIVRRETSKGFRALVVCESDGTPFAEDRESITGTLKPLSVVSIKDEVRPDCRDTIQVFLDNNMDLKVISGDDPVTIEALFKIADIPGERRIITGDELSAVSDDEIDEVVLGTNIFGRMKPENKERVIEVLKRNSKYVAMIGDGVNDVKSLKTAQVGVALESGSGAARGVADMILVNDNFAALPKALVEGRRTISGIRDILKTYISRNLALAIMYIMVFFFIGNTPMLPIQNLFYAFVAVTVIAFFMTIFAQPDKNNELILPNVLRFAIPSAITIGLGGVIVYLVSWYLVGQGIVTVDTQSILSVGNILGLDFQEVVWDYLSAGYAMEWEDDMIEIAARTSMILFASITGALQLLLVCPYFKFLSTDGNVNKRILPLLLVCFVLLLVTVMYAFVPEVGIIVGMARLNAAGFSFILAMTCLAFFIILISVKKDVMHHLVALFERWYLKKLDKEYTKGDVVNVESIDRK